MIGTIIIIPQLQRENDAQIGTPHFLHLCTHLGAVHKGRPQRRGRGVRSNADTCGQGDGGKGPCGRP